MKIIGVLLFALTLCTTASAHFFDDWGVAAPVVTENSGQCTVKWSEADGACKYQTIVNGVGQSWTDQVTQVIPCPSGTTYEFAVKARACAVNHIHSDTSVTTTLMPVVIGGGSDHCAPGTSLVDRRFGYGRNVSPPATVVTVTTWAQFATAAAGGNVWIQWDASLSNQVVDVTSLVAAGPNTWVDGSLASNAIFRANGSGTKGISFRQSNGVVHGMRFDGAGVSSTRIWLLEGQDYWIDKVEMENSPDDVLVISSDGQPALSDITISFAYSHDNVKGLLINAKTTSPVRRISFHGLRLENNNSRNWRWQAADEIHDWNSLISNNSIGINARITNGNIGSFTTARAIVESNVYTNVGNPWNISNNSSSVDPTYQHWLYTDGLNDTGGGSLIGNIDSGSAPAAHTIPYPYFKLPTAEVQAHVLSCAGIGNI